VNFTRVSLARSARLAAVRAARGGDVGSIDEAGQLLATVETEVPTQAFSA
jgi:hypothetical protein